MNILKLKLLLHILVLLEPLTTVKFSSNHIFFLSMIDFYMNDNSNV